MANPSSTNAADKPGFNIDTLISVIAKATQKVKDKLSEMSGDQSEVNIIAMFEMQMAMNHLSQLSEMTTGVVSASNSTIMAMARALKQ